MTTLPPPPPSPPPREYGTDGDRRRRRAAPAVIALTNDDVVRAAPAFAPLLTAPLGKRNVCRSVAVGPMATRRDARRVTKRPTDISHSRGRINRCINGGDPVAPNQNHHYRRVPSRAGSPCPDVEQGNPLKGSPDNGSIFLLVPPFWQSQSIDTCSTGA